MYEYNMTYNKPDKRKDPQPHSKVYKIDKMISNNSRLTPVLIQI